MKNFSRGGGFGDRKNKGNFERRSSGGRDSGGRGFGRDRSESRPEMHKAICAECGSPCEVPFKPSGDRPVLCSNCFKGKDTMNSNRSGGRDFSRPSFGDKQMFKATCAECGNSCEVPFKPSSGKPVFCSNCFGKTDKGRANSDNVRPSQANGITHEQFEMLNAKLDRILRALNPAIQVEKALSKDSIKKEIAKVESVVKAETKNVLKKIVKKVVAKKPAAAKKNKKK
jgi:CxxC-x17-CxxC domain-containing protein